MDLEKLKEQKEILKQKIELALSEFIQTTDVYIHDILLEKIEITMERNIYRIKIILDL